MAGDTIIRRRMVGVNDAGHVVGEYHHRARLTDHEVWLLHELIDAGLPLREVAEKFEISVHTAKSISCGRKRGQIPTAFKFVVTKVKVTG